MKRLSRKQYNKLARRPEVALEYDLHGLMLHGWRPGHVYEIEKVRHSAYRSPYGGSPNHQLRAIAVAAAMGEDVRGECADLLALFDARGHMLAEWCSPNYSGHQLEPLIAIVTLAADPNHPAAEILRRQLLLWAVLARPITCRDRRGRVEYRGYGWRPAGLRGTPNNWGGWGDSMMACEALRISGGPTGLGAKRKADAFNVAQRSDVYPAIEKESGALRELVFSVVGRIANAAALHKIAKGVRIADGMGAILARDTRTGDTFSCMTGTRKGGNTGATWAVHCTGPELRTHPVSNQTLRLSGDCAIAFPWRRANREHVISRVRRSYRGKPNFFQKAGAVVGHIVPGRDWSSGLFTCTASLDSSIGHALIVPHWVFDDSRAIRLNVTDEGATLNLPGGA